MQKTWLLGAVVALGLASAGCNTTCGNLQQAAKDCGTSFNSTTCSNAMASCSDADQQSLDDLAHCEDDPKVCNNGSVVNGFSFLGCVTAGPSISSACAAALSK
jgi:hypothetical protein